MDWTTFVWVPLMILTWIVFLSLPCVWLYRDLKKLAGIIREAIQKRRGR